MTAGDNFEEFEGVPQNQWSDSTQVVALQACCRRPGFYAFGVLGSPSVCFDPELLDECGPAAATAFFVLCGAEEAAVFPAAVAGARDLVDALRERGGVADGVVLVEGEDRASATLSLASRGLRWLSRRIADAEAADAAESSLRELEVGHAKTRSATREAPPTTPAGEAGRSRAWSPTLAELSVVPGRSPESDEGLELEVELASPRSPSGAAAWAALLPAVEYRAGT